MCGTVSDIDKAGQVSAISSRNKLWLLQVSGCTCRHITTFLFAGKLQNYIPTLFHSQYGKPNDYRKQKLFRTFNAYILEKKCILNVFLIPWMTSLTFKCFYRLYFWFKRSKQTTMSDNEQVCCMLWLVAVMTNWVVCCEVTQFIPSCD